MCEKVDYLELIRKAQEGCADSLNQLAVEARKRIFTYLYRLTLDYHLAQDLSQETMLKMVKSIKQLHIKDTSAFWTWLYRLALGKVQHHFRDQKHRYTNREAALDHEKLIGFARDTSISGLTYSMQRELSYAIVKSFTQLKLSHSNILTLRCFEQMSYAQIAQVTGGTELQARMLFFRAKQSLMRQLHNRGFKRGYFLSGLSLFAAISAAHTKDASAASTVTGASVKVGTAVWAIGTLTTKSGAVAAAATVLLGITAGTMTVHQVYGKRSTHAVLDYPSHLVNAYDPDGDGWKGTPAGTRRKRRVVSISPDALVGYRIDNANTPLVIIPDGHFLELGFIGTIVDGPGDDIEYIARYTGNYPRISLTDGMGQAFELPTISNDKFVNLYHVVGYDISGVHLPFEPNSLRLEGNGSLGPWAGAAIFNVTARISK